MKKPQMRAPEIKAVFDRTFGGAPSVLTPEVTGYGKRGRMIYELSRGNGYHAVTVLEINGVRRPDLSGAFETERARSDHIINDFER